MHTFQNPDAAEILALLKTVRTIAMVGASADPLQPSHDVMKFLQSRGYRVIPVNPNLQGKKLLDEDSYSRLADITEHIDMVDIFRNSEAAGCVTDEAIAIGSSIVWMQIGVNNAAAATRALAAGLSVVMNKCPKVELAGQ